MPKTSKKCVLILPYFGKFNNYFPLFLRSCGKNRSFDFLFFTDNTTSYSYPKNVQIIHMTFKEFKSLAQKQLGFHFCLPNPYKLCDFKPAYGLIFKNYIQNYSYWGHCDCDLIFGDMEKMLTPILDTKKYDKIFAAGHLTIYRNTPENNRRFMKPYHGEEIFRTALTTKSIYVFDEDNPDKYKNPEGKNVHSIFLEDSAKVYTQDLSMNVSMLSERITRSYYDPEKRRFIRDAYTPLRLYWNNGHVICAMWDKWKQQIYIQEYMYMHFHSRKLRTSSNILSSNLIEILPDRMRATRHIPTTKHEMHLFLLKIPTLFSLDVIAKRLNRKMETL